MVGLDGLLIFDGRRLRLDGTSQGLLSGPWRPLTVAQRLTLQNQLYASVFASARDGRTNQLADTTGHGTDHH